MSKQIGFCIEQDRCTGCKACQIACKDKNNLEPGQLLRTVIEYEEGGFVKEGEGYRHSVVTFFTSMSCNHCESPSCIDACSVGAIIKRDKDGIVYIDNDKCVGCLSCEDACAYESPVFNLRTEKMEKCDFCMDLLDKGETPACVAACPIHALHYGYIEELEEKFGKNRSSIDIVETDNKPALIVVPHRGINKD